MRHSHASLITAGLAATAALTLVATGCGGSSIPADFSLVQSPPKVTAHIANGTAPTRGDTVDFEAALTRDGHADGVLFGELTVYGLPGVAGRPRSEVVQDGHLVFVLKDGQITVNGIATYPSGNWRVKTHTPVVRAITGGARAYVGARGEITTLRNDDGTYTQAFHFVD